MTGKEGVSYRDTDYYCDICKTHRRLKINVSKHEELIESSKNGLVIYSDIHSCKDGLFEVNNLNIDKNYHIRTFEFLKLPEYRKKQKSLIPMPGMKKTDDDIDLIRIMEIDGNNDLLLLIQDHFLQTTIRVGRFDPESQPIDTLDSELTGITLHVYGVNGNYDDNKKEWIQYLINTLEILPPTKLGMLIETLRYFIDNGDKPPSDFDKTFVKTILASHEIFFEIKDISKVMDLYQKYSESFDQSDLDLIDKFLSLLQENPSMPIQYFTSKSSKDLVYQIYLFLILEKENIINIERPGIVKTS